MLQDPHAQKSEHFGFSRSDLRDEGDIETCSGKDEHGREISI